MIFDPSIVDHILFVFLAIILPVFAIRYVRPQASAIPEFTIEKIKVYWANCAILWFGALVVLLIWWLSGRDFSIMGFQLPVQSNYPEWLLVSMFFVLLYMFDSFVSWNEGEDGPASALLPKNKVEWMHFSSVVSLSAGVCEEIVFRGFLITYLLSVFAELSYGPILAIVLSSVVFGLVHAYQGWTALLKIIFLSILFATIFVVSESLLVVMTLHFFVDFLGGTMSLVKVRLSQH